MYVQAFLYYSYQYVGQIMGYIMIYNTYYSFKKQLIHAL